MRVETPPFVHDLAVTNLDPLAAIRWQPARPVMTVVGCHAGGEIGNVIVGGVAPPPGATVFEQMQALARGRLDPQAAPPRAARERRGPLEPGRPGDTPGLRLRLHHHGADRVPGDVRLEHDLRRHRAARDGHGRDARAGHDRPPRGPRRPDRHHRRLPGRQGRVGRVRERAVLRGPDRRATRGGGARHASLSTSRSGACGTRSRMRARSASRSSPSEARDLSRVGELIRVAAREQLPCVHPTNPAIEGVSIVQIAEPWRGVGQVTKNAVVVAPGRLDRSATGTGLSARLAALHARGLMQVGDSMTHASVIGSTFDGRIVREVDLAGTAAIVPAIRGSAWITGVTAGPRRPDRPVPRGLPPVRHVAGRRRPALRRLSAPCRWRRRP